MSAPPAQPAPPVRVEESIEAVFHHLASLRCLDTLRAFESELQHLHLLPPPPANTAAAAPQPPAPAPKAAQPEPKKSPQPPQQPSAPEPRGHPFEQYPQVPANEMQFEEEAPQTGSRPLQQTELELMETQLAHAQRMVERSAAEEAAAADDEEDEWQGDDDTGFIRVAAREQSFVEEELWMPERGRRPSFSKGAGIAAKEHKAYVREMINREHQKLLKDVEVYKAQQADSPVPPAEQTPSPKANAREEEGAADAKPAAAEGAREPATDDAVSEAGDEQSPTASRTPPKPAAEADPVLYVPPPPPQPVLEKFSLQVIYEKSKTGFEQDREFPVQRDSVIAGRYQILEYIGGAAFSDAVQCLDLKTNHPVCVKIIKNSKDYFDQSLDEIKLLQYINRSGDADDHCVLQLYDYFYYKEHLFLVSELLRDNLYEFSKYNRRNDDAPYFTVQRLQRMTKQILTALSFIHKLGLIHCDLKPENILIRSFSRCEVKVIDFGSSCFTHDQLCSYVQSRCYRAPEVILGLPYGQTIDMWSLGAILPELLTGNVLFYNDSVNTMLCRISAICGPFPPHMMKHARHAHKYMTRSGVIYEETKRGIELLFPRRTTLRMRMGNCKDDMFVDFVSQLLQVDPSKRLTAAEALNHPWLQADYGPLPPL